LEVSNVHKSSNNLVETGLDLPLKSYHLGISSPQIMIKLNTQRLPANRIAEDFRFLCSLYI
jgi:hypothetical protein